MKRVFSAVKANPFLFIFLLLGLRYVTIGAQLGDAIVFLSLCSLFAVDKYLAFKKGPDISVEVKKQLDDIKAHVMGMTLKQELRPPQRNEQAPPGPGQRWF